MWVATAGKLAKMKRYTCCQNNKHEQKIGNKEAVAVAEEQETAALKKQVGK